LCKRFLPLLFSMENTEMINKKVHVIGGGTISHVRSHLALAAPAYGATARKIAGYCKERDEALDTCLHLTKMADQRSKIETIEDLEILVRDIVLDPLSKIIFFSPALVDFQGVLPDGPSGKYEGRLSSRSENQHVMQLVPLPKLIKNFRQENPWGPVRKDLTLVGFKTTCGVDEAEQYRQGLSLLKQSSCNLVLANDTSTRLNMIITPEEACYHRTTDRDEVLRNLVEMAYLRSHLTFTRSTVVDGSPIAWDSSIVPSSLRTVVEYCIARGAYKQFRGVTAGHFAFKIDDTNFVTSRRKTDFNDMVNVGLVKVRTDGPDSVIAYGSKPSVGGQSQRIVFSEHPNLNCIVHFHCPMREDSLVPVVSQREFECGSHECGQNTSRGLASFGNLKAVYLDNHGPNIVFNDGIDPQEVISFIEDNFLLEEKTGGYVLD